MKGFLRNCRKSITTAFFVIAVAAIGTSQATIVSLGTTADFAVMSDSALPDADASTFFVTGDAGSFSASSVVGLPYANVNGILCLAPWTAGTLTLDGQFNPSAQWILQIGTAMTTPADAAVSLINSASANNVFWQIGSSLTLGANSAFAGNIIANASITLKAERGEDI
jgi:hypothetical protein